MLTVNDLMTVKPTVVTPDTSLRQVIGVMKREGCRQLPVVDSGKLIGIITDRDIRLIVNSPMLHHERQDDDRVLNEVTAESCMTANPITVTPDTPAYRAAEMLSIYKFGALPVVEKGGTLIGIITVTDFLDHIVVSHTNEPPRKITPEPLWDTVEQ